MSVLLKEKGQPQLKLIIESKDEDLFIISDELFINSKEFEPDSKLAENECYKINDFSNKDYCIALLKDDFDLKNFHPSSNINSEKADYLISIQNNENIFCFQKVPKAQKYPQNIIMFGESIEIKKKSKFFLINENPDAIYDKESDTLYFRRLSTITSIFKGIDQLERDATDKEVEDFLSASFISASANLNPQSVKLPNRRRITLASKILDNMSDSDRSELLSYIHDYTPQLKFNNSVFEISDEKQLTYLLYGIQERYYTTPVGKKKMLADSVQTLQ